MDSSQDFSRAKRLVKKQDFLEVFSSARNPRFGRSLRAGDFLIYQKFAEADPRLGISVSKKVTKIAAERNRIKRCVREFFRKNYIYIESDLVVRCIRRPKDFSYENLTRPMNRVLVKNDQIDTKIAG